MKDEDKTKVELIKELKILRKEQEKEAFKDITTPEKIEQVIRESEDMFRGLFYYCTSGIAIYEAIDNGRDFIIRDFNRAAEEIEKVKKEDIIGKSVLKVFPGVKDFGLFKVFQEVYKTGKSQHHPISLYQDQRISGWRENHIFKLPSGEVVAVYDDITERKQAEEKIEELAKFPTENPYPVLRISRDGTVLYHNYPSESLLRHWNYQEGKPLQDKWLQYVLDVLKDDDIKTVETEIGDKVIFLTFVPIIEKDFVNIYGLDITERKKMEERERYFKQVLLAIRTVNQLIVQETDPKRLIDQACQILTETLGYYNAWIALLDEDGKVISTAASNFDDSFTIFEEQLKQGKYPYCIKKAFQEKRAIVIDSVSDSCTDCSLNSGYVGRAALSGLIQYSDKLYGMLSVSTPNEYANLEETSKLFIELAGDLGLALYKIALEKEQKQVEQNLQESENRYRELFNHISSGISIYEAKDDGQDFIFKDFNPAAEKIGQIKKEDLLGKSALTAFPGLKDFGIFKIYQEVWKTGIPQYRSEYFYQDPRISGWRENYVYKLPSGEIVSVYDDITERKQAEEMLRRYEVIVSSSTDHLAFFDKQFHYLAANKAYLEAFKLTSEQLIGNTPMNVFGEEFFYNVIKPNAERCMSGEEVKYQEWVNFPAYGRHYMDITYYPYYNKDNQITGYVVNARNITRRKEAEVALQKAHDQLEDQVAQRTEELKKTNLKLQELDQLKSMFIASMSHELRTPLSFITGFTDIILSEISGKINKEQRRQLTLVKNSASHLLSLINDLIDINKIEAGKEVIIVEEFDLSALSQEIKETFKIAADKKGLELSLEVPPLLLIEGEERRTRQILVNLISNAVKFTDKGEVKIKIVTKDQMVEIVVWDTGIGIRRREDMDKLFIPFSRINRQGKIGEGTGLGLYLSKKNANLLGGDIMAESEFGKGSVFTLTLPIKYKEIKK